jgi:acyl dehydratase
VSEPRPIDRYRVGERATARRRFTDDDVRRFAELSGDFNELHLDDAAAASSRFGRRLVHGMLTASLFTRLLGMELPGRGVIYMSQTLRFTAPVYIGDEVEAAVEVVAVDLARKRLTLSTTCQNDRGQPFVVGEALVMVDV